ncbi:MAG: CPBP family intramembrane metalloprotease [Kiritimatiellae bacterium]|nr:CPBP family intramembrane metalloprotease [Kiritimatiellia bacterium]
MTSRVEGGRGERSKGTMIVWRHAWRAVGLFCAACALLAGPQPAAAGGSPPRPVSEALAWSLIPGGGHHYLGEHGAGNAYLGSVLAFGGMGAWVEDRNAALDRPDEVNVFWLLASKSWELSFFTTYRSAMRRAGCDLRAEGIDDTPVGGLLLAPFRREHLTNPWVLVAAALGVAAAFRDAGDPDAGFADIAEIGIMGMDANREWGSAAYAAEAFGLSLAAGVSEEAVWRGLLQNELDRSFGARGGLVTTSILFGIAHIVDLDGDIRPERTVVPTLAGLYLGTLFENEEHRLGPSIAAHFWYNFTLMTTAFALDPDANPLGVQVSFRF